MAIATIWVSLDKVWLEMSLGYKCDIIVVGVFMVYLGFLTRWWIERRNK